MLPVPSRLIATIALAILLIAGGATAQTVRAQVHGTLEITEFDMSRVSHVVVPQRRAFTVRGRVQGHIGEAVLIDGVKAHVDIRDRTARTTLEVDLRNPGSRQIEAILLLPVPNGAVVSEFLFHGSASHPTAQVLPADQARRTYDDIVRRVKDPALLEFAGYNLIRSSVFPLEAQGTQRIRLVYEHLLASDGARIDYVLPRSESLETETRWSITVNVEANGPIATVYSPSHELNQQRLDASRISATLVETSGAQPGPFRLSCLLEESAGVTASLYAYPDKKVGGGYFLLMAGLPASIDDLPERQHREVTLVIDRSGSMAGEKLDQVRAAALQVIEGLAEGEAFNIIDYATTVESFRPGPIVKTREITLAARDYLSRIRPTGGTNIHGALASALAQPTLEGMLPIVLFLTDGLPTVGDTSEVSIRTLVAEQNPAQRRIFSFGVGEDVNVPLLDRIADVCGAVATYALPGEDVELKLAGVFKRLYGPVLSALELATTSSSNVVVTDRVRELIPQHLPDLFEDDQLIVFGQYAGGDPLRFTLSGDFLGTQRTFAFDFDLSKATTRNAFVPRLWASRQIAYLVDQIRQAGATDGGVLPVVGAPAVQSAAFDELTNEILRLSTEFGILTEYTAFLATEGTNLNNWSGLVVECIDTLQTRAVDARCGIAAVNQGLNFNRQKAAAQVDYFNGYVDANLEQVEITRVQQLCDRSFFKQNDKWVDGRIVAEQNGLAIADEVIDIGSEAHHALVDRFIEEGRQAVLALPGEILVRVGDRIILVRNIFSDDPIAAPTKTNPDHPDP